ncbi:MAG TPA: hypothetical protein VMR62_20255, partial [Bryobacteraceae bacterium]|nr:hypothetical protein [Bryobacteraceae bacterium]
MPAIRTLAVAATAGGRIGGGTGRGLRARVAPAVLLGCGRRRSEVAALTMGTLGSGVVGAHRGRPLFPKASSFGGGDVDDFLG